MNGSAVMQAVCKLSSKDFCQNYEMHSNCSHFRLLSFQIFQTLTRNMCSSCNVFGSKHLKPEGKPLLHPPAACILMVRSQGRPSTLMILLRVLYKVPSSTVSFILRRPLPTDLLSLQIAPRGCQCLLYPMSREPICPFANNDEFFLRCLRQTLRHTVLHHDGYSQFVASDLEP